MNPGIFFLTPRKTFHFLHNMNSLVGQMTINRVFSITKQQDLLVLRGQEIRKWGKKKKYKSKKTQSIFPLKIRKCELSMNEV